MEHNMTTPTSNITGNVTANITGNVTANMTGNVTDDYDYEYPGVWDDHPSVPPLLTFIWSLLMVVGIIGNVGFIYVRSRVSYMKTLTNYYLVNLGIADTVYLLSVVPGEIRNLYYNVMDSLWNIEGYCIVMNTISSPCQYVSLFTLVVIAFERYFAICRPFKMSGITNKKGRAFRFIAITWIVAILVCVPIFLSCNRKYIHNNTTTLYAALLVIRLITFVPSMILVAILYFKIGRALTIRSNKSGGKDEQLRNERKQVVRMLGVTAAFFFICMIPTQVYTLITTLAVLKISKVPMINVGLSMFAINKTLMFLNSAANPLIYNVMSSKYRVAFKEAFGPLCCCVEHKSKQKYYYDSTNHTVVSM